MGFYLNKKNTVIKTVFQDHNMATLVTQPKFTPTGIMSELDWDEGIQVPVANEENKALEYELMKLQKELQTNTSTSEMLDDRISQMKDHMKNVEQELKQNLALIEAHEKRNNLENRVFGLNQQLEDVKKQVNWEQQALEAWLEESARRDEDALTLQKYSKSDNSKLKSLSLQIDKLTEECQKKRLYLEQEATETHSNEQALDKAAEEFRLEHADRKHLIEEWEKTIEHMLKRDREINASAAELGKVKEEVRAAQVTIREKQAFLERERLENAEI